MIEKQRARYSLDSDSRLVVNNGKEKLTVNGIVSVDGHNRLIYRINEPDSWRRKYGFPGKITFAGNWSLNENHDLELEITSDSPRIMGTIPAGLLVLKGEVISAENDKLVFEIKSADKNGVSRLRLLKFSGCWGSDEANQIFFSVGKKPYPDVLTFQGGWKLNGNQQIVYSYQKTDLKRKTKVLSEMVFSGFWQITARNRLAYIFSRATNSRFGFKVQMETPNLYPKDGEIKYRLGAGIKGLSPSKLSQSHKKGTAPDVITLYGTWKFSKRLGLAFEMEYAKGEIHSFVFGAEVKFNKNNEVVFNLMNERGVPLGINVIFTHNFLKQSDAAWFLRLKHSHKESGIDAGLKIPF
jgi:uncharacterized protein (UPF0548 family)